MNQLKLRPARFVWLILLLSLSVLTEAATITGSLLDLTGSPTDTTLYFQSRNPPSASGISVVVPTAKKVTTSGGSFTVDLLQGNYQLSSDRLNGYISVPAGSGTYNIKDVFARLVTFANTNDVAALFPALTGDVTTPPGSTATTISSGAVTGPKIASSAVGPSNVNRLAGGWTWPWISTELQDLGTIADGGTGTILTNGVHFKFTAHGAAFTLAVPADIPDATYIIEIYSTNNVDRQVVTLSNSACRPEQSHVTTNAFYLAATTFKHATVQLDCIGGQIETFHVTGDDFVTTPALAQIPATAYGTLSGTDAEAQLHELADEKTQDSTLAPIAKSADFADLVNVPSTGSQAEWEAGLSGEPRMASPLRTAQAIAALSARRALSATGSGTAYTVTGTSALVDMGTADPSLTLDQTGQWMLFPSCNARYVGATFAANQTIAIKLRRTNNTAADVSGATHTRDLDIVTTRTGPAGQLQIPPVFYTTSNTNDVIQLWAGLSATPSAGSVQINEAKISAIKISNVISDSTPPEMDSNQVTPSGVGLQIFFSEIVTFGAGGNGGFVVNASGGAVNATYSSGAGTTGLVYLLDRTISSWETLTLDYTQPGNGLEDVAGNDLATFSAESLTNDSTQDALNTSLISYWTLDETSTGAGAVARNDSEPTGTARNLTDNNTTASGAGLLNNGADFELSNSESLSIADNSDVDLSSGTSFSFSAWVRHESTNTTELILSQYGAAGNRSYAMQYSPTSDRYQMLLSNDGTAITTLTCTNATGPQLATWHHVVVTYSSSTHDLKIYQDAGTPSVATYSSGLFNSASTFRIGATAVPGAYWDGIIDEVGFWKRELTSGEISHIYNSGTPQRPGSIP